MKSTTPCSRSFVAGPILAVLIGLTMNRPTIAAETMTVSIRSTATLATATVDQNNQAFDVFGLSGITYLGGDAYAAVMDNSNKLVFINIELDSNGTILSSQITGGLSLAETRDFEGIAYTGIQQNSVYLSEENTPGIHEYGLSNGASVQSPSVPAVFQNIAANQGFESLTIGAGTSELWTANEQALTVDGSLATQTSGTTVRLLRYEATGNTYTPTAQFAYDVDPIHGATFTGSKSGLVDLVALPGGGLLALERSLGISAEEGLFKNSIFAIDFNGATDVSSLTAGLINQTFTSVTKTELWSGSVIGVGMNMEGLALGPALGGGRSALIGIVDDGDPLSINTLVSFELTMVPEPSGFSFSLIAAIAIVSKTRKRRSGHRQAKCRPRYPA